MKKISVLFALMVLLTLNMRLYADSFDPTTNYLTIPAVQAGSATYYNVVVNLGTDYQVVSVGNSGGGSGTTPDNYNASSNFLTIPSVTVVNGQTYSNVSVQLGKTFQIVSVGSCSGCNSGGNVSNVAPLLVDSGPTFQGRPLGSTNIPYTTVTVCQSGTNNCQIFDHILVDTGSTGFRIISSVTSPSLNLTAMTDAKGNAMVECMQWVTSFAWGTVKLADVKIAGEVAANIPIQVMGDTAYPIPASCSSGSTETDTVDTFGANGILGIGNTVYDCGAACVKQAITGAYYSCSGSVCQAIAAPLSRQVPNPVAFFPSDNNGTLIQLPAVPAQGATNIAGSLIFGIGTQSNNGLGGAGIYTLDASGYLTTIFNGATLTESFLDTGSDALFFNDNAISACSSRSSGAGNYCPPQTLNNLTATNQGKNGVSGTVSFSVANATNLFNNNPNGTAFSNLAGPESNLGSSGIGKTFDWGLTFFFGRSVFTAIENRTAGGVMGPYVAY